MESGVPSSPFEARWMLRPFSLALASPLMDANRSSSGLSAMEFASATAAAPMLSSFHTPPPPSSHWTERQVLTIVSNVVPASLVLLYTIWPCALVQDFLLRLPLISSLTHALRPFVSFDDIVVSLADEKRSLSKADSEEEDTAATGSEADEATPLLPTGRAQAARTRWPKPSVTIGLCVVSLVHLGVLLGHFCYVAAGHMWNAGEEPFSEVVTDLVLDAAGWVYVLSRTLYWPQPTPSYDTFSLLLVLLASGVVRLHLILISWYDGSGLYASPGLYASAVAGSILLCLYALGLVLSLPLSVLTPQMQAVLGYTSLEAALAAPADPNVDASKLTSPDAYCTLWQWVTFRWIDSLLEASKKGKIGEEDVWRLGADLKARVLDRKWGQLQGMGVIKRIWVMNSRDLLLDFFLTVVSTVVAYAKPLVLKRVLEGIQAGKRNNETPLGAHEVWMALVKGGSYTSHETAYAIAALGLLLVAVGSESDLQHLYAGRRCAVRTRGELISAMFSKGMRCKDISGAVAAVSGDKTKDTASEVSSDAIPTKAASANGKDAEAKVEDKKAKEEEEMKKAEESRGDQGVGRAVSLMSVDANGVGMFLSMLYFLYGAPLDLVICLIMLYTQLGWSAFVGFAVVPVVIPLQSIVMRQMIKLFKKVGNVRDSRMSALSELVNNLRLIKLINWENKFNERVIKLRNQELRLQFLRAVVGSLMTLIWSLAPASIAVLGFASYTIFYKQPLTVPVAFTALNLYQQLNRPLGTLPMMINHSVSMIVSAGRIQRFLDYPEVPEGVSTLHRPVTHASMPLRNNVTATDATFRWHSTVPLDEPDKAKQPRFASVRKAFSKVAFWRKDSQSPPAAEADATDAASSTAASTSDPNAGWFTLHNITLTIDEGLTLVCGSTGSGKSSLLAGLLGEMDILSGKLVLDKQPGIVDPATGLHGGISFCAQQPWLQQKSVRDNILFGEPMDMDRYKAVLEACALMPDIELFDDGDLQEIGEGGISLSGGQKARVALARAVYSKARTVLLDDVLSAVDAHTARNLVTGCLTGPLMQNRCILLVTHHVDLVLPYVQRVVKMEKGSVAAMGPAEELIASGAIEVHTSHDTKGKGKSSAPSSSSSSSQEDANQDKVPAAKSDKPSKIGPLDGSKATHHIVEQEKVRVGRVKSKVYGVYLNALGWFMIGLVGFTLVLCNVTELSSSVWLSYWSSGGSQCGVKGQVGAPIVPLTTAGMVYHSRWTPYLVKVMLRFHLQIRAVTLEVAGKHCWLPPADSHPLPYMLIFAVIEFTSCIMAVVTNILMYVASLRASRALFVRMLDSVSHATSRWLDKTPSGQILNRFGKDIESLDFGLLQSSSTVLFQIFSLLTAFATLSFLVPAFIIPALGVVWLYYTLSKVYVACSRDLRRLESAHRSPIFSGYSEALKGIATIRAFSAETRLLYEVYGKVDAFSSAHYFWWMTNRWLMLRVELVGGLCVFATQFLALSGAMSAGMAAVAITQAANFTQSCYWLSRGWANLEQELTSIERVVDYLPPKIPQEPPQHIEGHQAPAAWPSPKATIKFDNVWLRYDQSFDPVLKGVSFEIRPGEKVGIVGRTGSGKSTCASSLLRFVDPEKGTISIDGIDIRTLGLHDLRSRISFIPQDPVLFQGQVRDNLDPFGEHTDEECRNALAQVRLSRSPTASQAVSRAPSRPASAHDGEEGTIAELDVGESSDLTLDSPVADSGGNLSQGQRQLLAMARALLSHNHIVIADEATASVDFASDRLIQQVIRDRFKDNIMLVIAHRLTTIAEFSRVLVLDAGKVVEFDTPANLLAKEDGYFYQMAQHSGVYDTLVKMAQQGATSS